jgi:hypothetical protein
VYLTHADSFLQDRFGLDASDITKEIRFSCLSQRSLVIPTSFILKSDRTFDAIKDNLPLLEEGIIVPAIPEGCESFESYYKARIQDPLFLKIGRLGTGDPRAKLDLLENHSKYVMSFDEASMMGNFVKSLANDISSLVEEKDRDLVLQTFNDMWTIRREHFLRSFAWLPKDKLEAFGEYLDLLYYLQGGVYNNIDLSIHPSYLPSIRTRLVKALPETKLPREYDIFRETINVLSLSQDILLSVHPEKMLDLRGDPAVRRFLDKLEKLYEGLRHSHLDQVSEFENLRTEVNEAIMSELSSEVRTFRKFRNTKKIMRGFAYVTGLLSFFGLGPVLGPATGLVATASAYRLVDPFLDEVWKRVGNCEMIFFTQVLLDASYQR